MSANGARNRVVTTEVRIEAVHSKQTAEDHTGKPDLPCVNIGEPQRAEGAPRNTPPKVSRLSLICADTGSSPGMLRSMGSRRGANALRKADAPIWNTDEGGVAEWT